MNTQHPDNRASFRRLSTMGSRRHSRHKCESCTAGPVHVLADGSHEKDRPGAHKERERGTVNLPGNFLSP